MSILWSLLSMLPNFLGNLKDYLTLSPEKLSELCKGVKKCPYCSSDDVIQWGYYYRNVHTLDEKVRIMVKRMFCKKPECSHTFSLLPCFLLPYQHWSVCVLETVFESVTVDEVSVNRALMKLSIEENGIFVPGFDTLYRMWYKICSISVQAGDNVYSFVKQLEPDIDPFSNPDYQYLLDRKGSCVRWLKLGLQWVTSKMVTKLNSIKLGGSADSLSLLHYCTVYPDLSFDSS